MKYIGLQRLVFKGLGLGLWYQDLTIGRRSGGAEELPQSEHSKANSSSGSRRLRYDYKSQINAHIMLRSL